MLGRMRVLVSTTAGAGHFGPLLPFARALVVQGHDVLVAAPASFAATVERAGFAHHPFADASPEELGAVFARLPGLSNHEGNLIVVSEVFGRIDAKAALPGVQEVVARWRPDLVLREASEYASFVVADRMGIPHAQVAVSLAAFEDAVLPALEAPLAELSSPGGVAALRAAPRFTLLPFAFEGAATAPSDTRRFRDESPANPAPLPAGWWPEPHASDPLVYVTFGSVAADLGLFPMLYQAVVAAVADLPVRVLLTLGSGGDPEVLGALPPNVHVERWWAQADIMPRASAMVGHGGFGTTLAGLAAGVPQVVVPLFADQPHNAARVEAVGAGIALEGGPGAIGGLADALRRLLGEDYYRTSAAAMADHIGRLPPAVEAVPLLEDIAKGS